MLGFHSLGESKSEQSSIIIESFRRFNISPSNPASVNGMNLHNAITAAIGDGLSLVAEEGDYSFDGGTFECGFQKFSLIAAGPRVTFRQVTTGAGRFISFNGHANYPIDDAVKRIVFGGAYPIMVRGCSGTTDLIYANKVVDSKFNVRVRDADTWFRVDAAGQPPASPIGAVLCQFDVTASQDWDEERFVIGSTSGFSGSNVFASECRLNLEGNGLLHGVPVAGANYAGFFDESRGNKIKPLSSMESNGAGGLWFSSSCVNNSLDCNDNEVNGFPAYYDLVVEGTRTRVCNFAGRSRIDGDRNEFHCCNLKESLVGSLGNGGRNVFWCCDLTGWTDVGNTSVVRSCIGAADKN